MPLLPDEPINEDNIVRSPRRHEARRRRVEEALARFATHHHLPSDSVERLAEEIYGLWREHELHKRLDYRDRRFHSRFRREARTLTERTTRADVDALEHAKRMVRLETLERRNVGSSKAIEGAIAASYDDLLERLQ